MRGSDKACHQRSGELLRRFGKRVCQSHHLVEPVHLSRERNQIRDQREKPAGLRLTPCCRRAGRRIGATGRICIVCAVGGACCTSRLIVGAPGRDGIKLGDRALQFRDLRTEISATRRSPATNELDHTVQGFAARLGQFKFAAHLVNLRL